MVRLSNHKLALSVVSELASRAPEAQDQNPLSKSAAWSRLTESRDHRVVRRARGPVGPAATSAGEVSWLVVIRGDGTRRGT